MGGYANGSNKLTTNQVAIIKAGDVYVNVSSSQELEGLLSGQVDKNVIRALDINLSSESEIPSITDRTDR